MTLHCLNQRVTSALQHACPTTAIILDLRYNVPPTTQIPIQCSGMHVSRFLLVWLHLYTFLKSFFITFLNFLLFTVFVLPFYGGQFYGLL